MSDTVKLKRKTLTNIYVGEMIKEVAIHNNLLYKYYLKIILL